MPSPLPTIKSDNENRNKYMYKFVTKFEKVPNCYTISQAPPAQAA